jgi:hypothetical protein
MHSELDFPEGSLAESLEKDKMRDLPDGLPSLLGTQGAFDELLELVFFFLEVGGTQAAVAEVPA